MVIGRHQIAVLIVSEIHPSIYDIVPSVVKVVAKRYRGYVEESDLRQECYLFAASKYAQHKELLDEPNTEKRQQNERKIGWQIKRVAERYARKEKATKAGYQTTDEAYCETTTIAQLLPFVIGSILTGKPFEQGQQLVDDGQPKARVVLLKKFNEEGYIFYTNYNSEKGKAILNNPNVCLSFFWPTVERQIIIKGIAEKTTDVISDNYFSSRPDGSKLGAIVSPQSEVIPNREFLEKNLKTLEKEWEGKEILRPAHCGVS